MSRKLALQGRIVLLAAFIVVAFLGVCAWMFVRYSSAVYQEKDTATRHIVEVAAATVERYAAEAAAGRLTTAEAQRQALADLKAMRYGEGDYVWVNDMGPRMLMHPTNPKLNGQDLSAFQDPTGRRLFVEMVDVCRRSGGGIVHYLWAKPKHDEPQPKSSYVKRVAAWDWVVGSGVYVDDVRDQLWVAGTWFAGAVVAVLLLTTVVGWRLVRGTVGPIGQATKELQSGSDEVTSASVQVAGAATSLSDDATRQAASIQQISSSMEEMASLTRANADHAGRVAASATGVGVHVEAANQMLERMARSMTAIEQSSAKVTGIVKAIDEIAFQTNILALNAAVEAARAGAAGMGFAVVADEVRALAQRAATAAHDAAALVEESVRSARDGTACLGEFSSEMGQVTAGMASMREAAGAVREGSDRQRQGIEQVSKAVDEMERVTQKTAAMAEETAAASEELQAQAETSRAAVREIAAVVGVTTAHERDATVPPARAMTAQARPSSDLRRVA
jgi:methyl-accepting chemotaxis protein